MSGTSARRAWRAAAAVLVTTLMFTLSPQALALTCATQTMEQSYEQSAAVFLARIVSAELMPPARTGGGGRSSIRHHFELVEMFKGEVKYDSFESDLQWGTSLAHFAIGDTNLFFMRERPGFDSCTPRYLTGQPDTTFVLDKLRSLKSGVVDSISGSWVTNTSATRCSMYTTYLLAQTSGSLSMSLGYTKATEMRPARSAVWMYSQARRSEGVVSDDGLVLSFGNHELVVPHSSQPTAQTANFYQRLDELVDFLEAVLSGDVRIEGVTRSDQPVNIAVVLNGGNQAVEQFAECSELDLTTASLQP